MDNDGRRIDAEFYGNSTRYHSNTLYYPAQGNWQRPHNHQQHLLAILPLLHDCLTPKLPRIHCQIHPTHSERKQDLTPTNQNTRSSTRRHSISRILVPPHDHGHNKHSRRLKPPNHQIFTVLDPFYPRHFALPFGLPAVPYHRGRPNVQRWISPTTHPLNISSRV